MSDMTIRLSRHDPLEWRTVEVPTEDGRKAVIDFYRHREGFWSVDIAEELIESSPEGLTAVLLLAFRALSQDTAEHTNPARSER